MSDARRLVLSWLCIDGRDPADCSQREYQQFAWHTVPVKIDGPRADVAEACAALLEGTGRPRAAAAMRERSPGVLAAWERSASEGFDAFVAANDATGITPPDTPLLAWAAVFGGTEAAVLDAAERLLEHAVETGRLVPGGRAWRLAQREILTEWLTAPARELDGAVPVDAVLAERQQAWLASGGPARRAAIRRALDVVEPAPEPPAPLQALLDAAVEPIALTAALRVPPRVVGELAERFGWTFPGMPGRSEAHIPQFVMLREFATDAQLLARRGRTLRLSPAGRAAQADPAVLAVAAAAAWFGPGEFIGAVAEVAAAVLLRGPAPVEKIVDVVAAAVAPSFRTPDGTSPDRDDLLAAVYEWIRPGSVLGWLAHTAGEDYALTAPGRRAACAGLRHRAHAPRSTP